MNILGIEVLSPTDDFFMADELGVSGSESTAAQGRLTGRVHLAFQAADEAQVKAFYDAALKAGGQDNGAPGEPQRQHDASGELMTPRRPP